MKRGKPRDIRKSKNRIVSVVLTEYAYKIYRDQCAVRSRMGNKQPSRWIHNFVSTSIIDQFSKGKESVLIQELVQAQDKLKEAEDEIKRKASALSIYRDEQSNKKELEIKRETARIVGHPV